MEKLSDIGMIGLAVMGSNLALNMESKGFRVSVYNRTVKGVEEGIVDKFINGRAKGKNFFGTDDLEKFVKSLQKPRKIMMKCSSATCTTMMTMSPQLRPASRRPSPSWSSA